MRIKFVESINVGVVLGHQVEGNLHNNVGLVNNLLNKFIRGPEQGFSRLVVREIQK